jgi:hypothetical protein
VRIVCLLLCAACSSGSGTPTKPSVPTPTGPADAAVTTVSSPSEKECEQLVAHVVELTVREHAPAINPAPNDAESQKMDQSLRPYVAECTTLSREAVRCGLDAPTLAALRACQATRSSSTSNSSVAPPGIKPPAPRSP